MRILQRNDVLPVIYRRQALVLAEAMEHALLETHVSDQIPASLYRLSQEDVPGGSDSYYVGVLAERLERDWVMDFTIAFPRIV